MKLLKFHKCGFIFQVESQAIQTPQHHGYNVATAVGYSTTSHGSDVTSGYLPCTEHNVASNSNAGSSGYYVGIGEQLQDDPCFLYQ